jgi:hypothetical protein
LGYSVRWGSDEAFLARSGGRVGVGRSATWHGAGVGSERVDGSVNPGGQSTTYKVEYDLASSTWCTSFGSSGSPANSTAPQTLGFTDTSSHSVSVSLTGLTGGTSYCADLVATNGSGTGDGGQVPFTTSSTPVAPTVTTGSATGVSTSAATIAGTVNPNGLATSYQFEYGTTTGYGSSTASASAGSGPSTQAVSAPLTGLSPNTTYHYRLDGTSSAGTSNGSDQTFTTSATPVVPGPPSVSGVALASKTFSAKQGTTLTLTLSEPATVTVVVTTTVKGRKVKGVCKATAKKGKSCNVTGHKVKGVCKATAKKGKSCKLTVKKGSLTFNGVNGPNSHKFRMSSLPPRRYTATLTARDAAGRQSKPFTFTFTITKPRKGK